MASPRTALTALLEQCGVTVDGTAPWDIKVRDERFFSRVLAKKSLGFGESYVEGWWDCPRVDDLVERLVRARAADQVRGGLSLALAALPAHLRNLQTPARSRQVAERHYDLGNDLFETFLDHYLQYSCAYFGENGDLDAAQVRKMRLICEKLELEPGDAVLDVGCGWGGLARFMAEEYGCSVVGVNISGRQIEYARGFCAGLPVEIRACDYREMAGSFDKIVSVGMFEHVGPKNHRAFMRSVARCLKPDGLFLLHTIGSNVSSQTCDPWIERFIFPNGCLPSMTQIARAAEDVFVVEDLHNLGPHYARTLACWLANFRAGWGKLRATYGEGFKRMWEYYLQASAGAFRARDIQLWQLLLTHPGAPQPHCR
ncbi:MAG: cyclopropane fatty acyl phospholipid synthase [Desulfovibrionaceae bacterium]|nr:cyclopropane fatty acyl phospholipid synthase [Desulfovibrionaceae bacterium]